MTWEIRQQNGALAEAKAVVWLIENGWRVYRCISGNGPADLMISNDEGELKIVDVKYRGFTEYNTVIRANITPKQRAIGVEFLYVTHNGDVIWDKDL